MVKACTKYNAIEGVSNYVNSKVISPDQPKCFPYLSEFPFIFRGINARLVNQPRSREISTLWKILVLLNICG